MLRGSGCDGARFFDDESQEAWLLGSWRTERQSDWVHVESAMEGGGGLRLGFGC